MVQAIFKEISCSGEIYKFSDEELRIVADSLVSRCKELDKSLVYSWLKDLGIANRALLLRLGQQKSIACPNLTSVTPNKILPEDGGTMYSLIEYMIKQCTTADGIAFVPDHIARTLICWSLRADGLHKP